MRNGLLITFVFIGGKVFSQGPAAPLTKQNSAGLVVKQAEPSQIVKTNTPLTTKQIAPAVILLPDSTQLVVTPDPLSTRKNLKITPKMPQKGEIIKD